MVLRFCHLIKKINFLFRSVGGSYITKLAIWKILRVKIQKIQVEDFQNNARIVLTMKEHLTKTAILSLVSPFLTREFVSSSRLRYWDSAC